jgi:hypothetical protein
MYFTCSISDGVSQCLNLGDINQFNSNKNKDYRHAVHPRDRREEKSLLPSSPRRIDALLEIGEGLV